MTLHHLRSCMVVLSALVIWAVFLTDPASACTTCVGMYTDISLMDEVIYQVEKVHSYLIQSLAGAEAAAQSGQFSSAALLPMGLGFAYGAVHAIGPGHGKLVVAGYFSGRSAPMREAFRMAGEIAALHVGSAAAIAVFAAILLGGVIDASGPAFTAVKLISYGLIVVAGGLMLYRAAVLLLAPQGVILPWPGGLAAAQSTCGHDHGDDPAHPHAHAHHDKQGSFRERGMLSLAVGAVPCTGALIAVLFALASGAWMLGLLTVVAISIGMALTLAGVGVLTIWTRGAVSADASLTLNSMSALGGVLVILVGAALFYGTAAAG